MPNTSDEAYERDRTAAEREKADLVKYLTSATFNSPAALIEVLLTHRIPIIRAAKPVKG